jgi:hypothetical protein
VTFSLPEEVVRVHASDNELTDGESTDSTDEVTSNKDGESGGGESDGGSPCVPVSHVKKVVS